MRPSRANPRSPKSPRNSRSRRGRHDEAETSQPAAISDETRDQLQAELLAQITHGGRLCAEVERQLGESPAPELETLIKLYRVLILKFSLEANVAPELFKLVCDLMKPVMDWARLQEKRKDRELAEQKHRDRIEAKTARETKDDGLAPDTLQKIQREINLF